MTPSEKLTTALAEIRAQLAGGGTLGLNFNLGRPEGWPVQIASDVPSERIYWQDNECELE